MTSSFDIFMMLPVFVWEKSQKPGFRILEAVGLYEQSHRFLLLIA
jgi:hypothetical protein